MNQQKSDTSKHESTRIRHELTRTNTSPTQVNTSQLDQETITVYRNFIWESIITPKLQLKENQEQIEEVSRCNRCFRKYFFSSRNQFLYQERKAYATNLLPSCRTCIWARIPR